MKHLTGFLTIALLFFSAFFFHVPAAQSAGAFGMIPPPDTTADVVYGQGGSFTTNLAGVQASALDHPYCIIEDANGGLYVADTLNNRVLYYPPASGSTGASTTATRVYGQGGDFTTNIQNKGGGPGGTGVSADSLLDPTAVDLVDNGGSYQATFVLTSSEMGDHVLSASYAGNTNFAASPASAVTLRVGASYALYFPLALNPFTTALSIKSK